MMGRPRVPRGVQREFWRLVRQGVGSEEAAVAVGVSASVGQRWFTEAGGMPPMQLAEPSSRSLSLAEREEIAVLNAQKYGPREIGRRLNRAASTISRELARNSPKGRPDRYRATSAQSRADARVCRPKAAKLAECERLRGYVQDK